MCTKNIIDKIFEFDEKKRQLPMFAASILTLMAAFALVIRLEFEFDLASRLAAAVLKTVVHPPFALRFHDLRQSGIRAEKEEIKKTFQQNTCEVKDVRLTFRC